MNLALFPAPQEPGAYRWYYVDATCGEWTAVAIFMVGAQFSHRYSVAGARGEPPERHCAINFALYREGQRRAWVYSEYDRARVEGHTLSVGGSRLSYQAGRVRVQVRERRAPLGSPLEAELVLEPSGPGHAEVQLVAGQPHFWQPLVPRATATLSVPALGAAGVGDGYHDTNRGTEPLGRGLRGWDWSRTHTPEATHIRYHPWDGAPAIAVHASRSAVSLERAPASREVGAISGWGLALPRGAPPTTLETSPFYARLEERGAGRHVMSEVADFRRFHHPWVRWMSRFRTRTGAEA